LRKFIYHQISASCCLILPFVQCIEVPLCYASHVATMQWAPSPGHSAAGTRISSSQPLRLIIDHILCTCRDSHDQRRTSAASLCRCRGDSVAWGQLLGAISDAN
jgi:hypothetical protein